ncbi:MAG TPA: glycoside hydrolase family 44 protein [Gemmataceae bacterium]|nr:glycoside hydrolase family 44 protein [Gemmataceae bacterium]
MRTLNSQLFVETLESRVNPATVTVDAGANLHAIDPNVYGTAFATTAQLADLNVPLNRNGGNASDTYSFPQDATNHASDWYFTSDAVGTGNGQGIDSWVTNTKAGGAEPSLTLNLFDWAARLPAGRTPLGAFPVSVYGPQQDVDPYWPEFGNGKHVNGTNITNNDPSLAYETNNPAIEHNWIQHLIDTFGNSQNGGVQFFNLGNEPGLWNSTHRDIHPAGDTVAELRDKIISYASMVKALDPNAKIVGPEEWGWTNYFIDGADAAASNWGAKYNGLDAEAWLLKALHDHDATTGTRLLDYFTLHFYPQGGQFSDDLSTNMQLLRNRSTRSLWDPNYVDESWIASTGIDGGKVNLINRMKAWVNGYYPGTKIGVTEYNWGAEGDMNGATTQADIWGIFGREGLDLANRWTTPATGTPTYLAMKMFRNYDGSDSAFGNTSVSAAVANPDQVSAFASIRASDGALTVMVINKNLSTGSPGTTPITLNLSNFNAGGPVQVWQLVANSPSNQGVASINHLANASLSGGTLTANVPLESVTMFVIPAGATAPGTPNGLLATPGVGQVALSWNAVGGATSYKVYRGLATGTETPLQANLSGANYTDSAVTNGTAYFYTVSAVNVAGEGAQSLEVSATPQATAPNAPSGLDAIAISPFQINLTWTDNSSDETGFIVDRALDSGFTSGLTTANVAANTTSYHATGLAAGTTYWFRVRAANGAVESASTLPVSATTMVDPRHGLTAVYFNNMNFSGYQVSKLTPQINFNWGVQGPVPGIAGKQFSARWTGQILAGQSGLYRFRTMTDDGVRLWVNGNMLIDHWKGGGRRTKTSGDIAFLAGEKYDIQMDFFENRGAAMAKLLWRRPGQTTYEVVPQAFFTPMMSTKQGAVFSPPFVSAESLINGATQQTERKAAMAQSVMLDNRSRAQQPTMATNGSITFPTPPSSPDQLKDHSIVESTSALSLRTLDE